MLAQIGVNRWGYRFCNYESPSTTPGTSVIPGASDAEGDWTEIIGDANVTQDIWLLTVWVAAGASSGQIKSHLMDIGVDPSGGTSYAAIISNIVCGQSAIAAVGGGYLFVFPIFISSGSAIAVRIQGSNGTAGTVVVGMTIYGQPSHPELIRVGQYSETIGTITGSAGVSFTPGATGAEGTWVSLGTLTRACWWFQLAFQFSDAGMQGRGYLFDLAYGDANNKQMIIESLYCLTGTSEEVFFGAASVIPQGFADLPSGTELWVRGSCSGTVDTTNAVAIGIGG